MGVRTKHIGNLRSSRHFRPVRYRVKIAQRFIAGFLSGILRESHRGRKNCFILLPPYGLDVLFRQNPTVKTVGYCLASSGLSLKTGFHPGCKSQSVLATLPRRMTRILQLLPVFYFLFSFRSLAQTNDLIARAAAAIEAATPRAQADPAHPIFHVTSPAQWINDPNGPIYYKGFYHLFYQLHPFSDGSGPKYWGHVRSRDLAMWEYLPIALAPSEEAGEAEIWSGCCTINGRREPMIFYTSVGPGKPAFDHAEQWAAIGDDDLIHWKKSPLNPVLPEAVNGATKIYDWRDPFIFHDGKKTFLVAGGHLEKQGHAAVNIYEAHNPELTKWTYRGALFDLPDPKTPTAECPNFFKLGNQWVLFVSPYGKVQYFVGDFDAVTCRFRPRTNGMLDYGASFYAPNTMQAPDGRRITWGWVNGFPGGHGWNGCLSLPRLLSLSREGQLLQNPAPQLNRLRGKLIEWRNLHLDSHNTALPLPKTNAMEIQLELTLNTESLIDIKLKSGAKDAQPIYITFNRTDLAVMDARAPLEAEAGRKLSLRIFIDRSVLEVFANETVCVTKVIPPLDSNATLELRAFEDPATAKLVRAWPMQTIWQ
jgi:beta-fructofuranosidase